MNAIAVIDGEWCILVPKVVCEFGESTKSGRVSFEV